MNGSSNQTSGSSKTDGNVKEAFVVKPSNLRIWIHTKDLGKLTRVLWAGQGNRLRSEASTNPKIKKFLDTVPYVLNVIKEVHQAVVDNNLDLMQIKIEPPVPPSLITTKDINGLTVMHKAAGLAHTSIVEYLVRIWPDGATEIDATGKTPLHWAASAKNNTRCYNLLVQAGADEEALDYKMKPAAYYKQRPNDIDRSLLTVIPDAPRVPQDIEPDWDALLDDIGRLNRVEHVVPKVSSRSSTRRGSDVLGNGLNLLTVRSKANSIDNTSEPDDMDDGEKISIEEQAVLAATEDKKLYNMSHKLEKAKRNVPREEIKKTESSGDDLLGQDEGDAVSESEENNDISQKDQSNDDLSANSESRDQQDSQDLKDEKREGEKEEKEEKEVKEEKEENEVKEEKEEKEEEDEVEPSSKKDTDDHLASDTVEIDNKTEEIAVDNDAGEEEVKNEDIAEIENKNADDNGEETEQANDIETNSRKEEDDNITVEHDNNKDEEPPEEETLIPLDFNDAVDEAVNEVVHEAVTDAEHNLHETTEIDSTEMKTEDENDTENVPENPDPGDNDQGNVNADNTDGENNDKPLEPKETDLKTNDDKEDDKENDNNKAECDNVKIDDANESPIKNEEEENSKTKQDSIDSNDNKPDDEETTTAVSDNIKNGNADHDIDAIKNNNNSKEDDTAGQKNDINSKEDDNAGHKNDSDNNHDQEQNGYVNGDRTDENHNALKRHDSMDDNSPSPPMEIEGVVRGEPDNNQVQSQSGGFIVNEESRVQSIIESGDMEQLASLVLNGEGRKLMGARATQPEIQAFLDNVPQYMNKIRRVHMASREGDLRDLQSALDRRKFAIAKDDVSPSGASPLHVATVFGHAGIVRYLGGRFPETTGTVDEKGRTALHYAATINDNGHFYNLLTHLGSNPKATDQLGNTAEYYTDHERCKDILSHKQLLKDFGADEDLEEEMLSDQGLGEPLIKGLTEVADKRPEDPVGYLATFLQNFSKIDTIAEEDQTQASSFSNSQIPPTRQVDSVEAEALAPALLPVQQPQIQPGNNLASPSTSEDEGSGEDRDEHGQSMLHFACARSHGRNALFNLIEESNINITYRDELYRTARDVSLQATQPNNAKEIDRYVLMLAARGNVTAFQKMLLDGYDHILDVTDEEGVSIIDVARTRGHQDLARFLENVQNFEESREALHQAIRNGDTDKIHQLTTMGDGAQLAKAKNYYGRCAIHIAVLKEQEDIVEYLVSSFKNALRTGDNLERTPLHYAMGINSVETISRILIRNGAKRIVKDLKGRQPSYYFMNKADILRLQEEEEEE